MAGTARSGERSGADGMGTNGLLSVHIRNGRIPRQQAEGERKRRLGFETPEFRPTNVSSLPPTTRSTKKIPFE
jgi:hypothetical protein